MAGFRTILHPTDFSEKSEYAFQVACELAQQSQATLLVLHVMMPAVAPLSGPAPNPRLSAESQKGIGQFPWPRAAEPQLRLDYRLAEGDAPEEVLRFARTEPCDLIVMGTHGRSGMERLLMGSVAEEVLRKADCPVLVVKAPLEAACPLGERVASPGELVDVRPLGATLTMARTRTLLHGPAVEIVRLVVPAGEQSPQNRSAGPVILQCLEGRVALSALNKTEVLQSGSLVLLPADESYALEGIENASVLLTTFSPQQ